MIYEYKPEERELWFDVTPEEFDTLMSLRSGPREYSDAELRLIREVELETVKHCEKYGPIAVKCRTVWMGALASLRAIDPQTAAS